VFAEMVFRAWTTGSITKAALFRVIDKWHPTLLIDEVDTFVGEDDELRGILNQSHRYDGAVTRTEGDDHEPRRFSVYAAVALSGIGGIAETLIDRSVIAGLQRRRPSETIVPLRIGRMGHLHELRRRITRWVADHEDRIAEREPEMPSIIDREADNWHVLLAIADEAGGKWPERARKAAVASHTSDMDEGSRLELVLGDIRTAFAEQGTKLSDIFGVEQVIMSSAKLVKVLIAIEGHPWAEMGKAAKPLTANRLARMLKPLGIVSKKVGPEKTRLNGYQLSQFEEVFSRYLPPEGDSNRTAGQPSEKSKTYDDSKPDSQDDGCPVAKCPNPLETLSAVRLSGCEEGTDANASAQPSNASAEQQESAPVEGSSCDPSSDPAPEKISLSRVNSKPDIRTAGRKPKRDDTTLRGTSSDPVYAGPVVDVPDQGPDPFDEHGALRKAGAAKSPPLTPGHARDLRAWSLEWSAGQEAKGLEVSTAGLEAELRLILREELPPEKVEAAIAQVMDLVFNS